MARGRLLDVTLESCLDLLEIGEVGELALHQDLAVRVDRAEVVAAQRQDHRKWSGARRTGGEDALLDLVPEDLTPR